MKIWLFALVQSAIAALGLVAYFWGENMILASAAAVLAAVVAIAQPLLSARKQQQFTAYHNRQFTQSMRGVSKQVKSLLKETIDPPLPHRESVAVGLRLAFPHEAKALLADYDAAVHAVSAGRSEAAELAADFADATDPWSVGPYLQGLAALGTGQIEKAHEHFSTAREAQTSWVAPWLGWATTAYRLGRIDEICEQHPHINGIDLLPYDCGDEQTFLQIDEAAREELGSRFQKAAQALGNYYTIAELSRSKEQINRSHEEFKQVA